MWVGIKPLGLKTPNFNRRSSRLLPGPEVPGLGKRPPRDLKPGFLLRYKSSKDATDYKKMGSSVFLSSIRSVLNGAE